MIKVDSSNLTIDDALTQINKPRKVKANLIADKKEEVEAIGNDGSTVDGLREGDILEFGSTCLCIDGSFGMLGSNGNWTF